MDVGGIERALAATEARTLVVSERVLRRVVKSHRRLPGTGLQVPHARCYAVSRTELLGVVDASDLGRSAADLPEHVLLVPRPEADDPRSDKEILVELWRYAFHAQVHVEMERLVASNAIDPERIRERVHRVGQTEFDEIRAVLRQDRFLLVEGDDLETYIEFVAYYLELSRFDPPLVAEVFPDLADAYTARAIEDTIALDLDIAKILEATHPPGISLPVAATAPITEVRSRGAEKRAGAARPSGDSDGGAPSSSEESDARARGNLVRAMLLAPEPRAVDARALAELLNSAVQASTNGQASEVPKILDIDAWTAILLTLAKQASSMGSPKGGLPKPLQGSSRGNPIGSIFKPVAARLLFDLQKAGIAGAKAIGKVDLVHWITSLGRTPLARLLPATRELRVARELAVAINRIARVDLPEEDRGRLRDLLADARHHADASIRIALGPRIEESLKEVGFVPTNVPERVALTKVVEELLDQATLQGHLTIGQLRDAVSRNQLKMGDLRGPGELFSGDALLLADKRLSVVLDGVHRRGELYLRGLQKVSSLLFGTQVGRFITFFILLPVGGAYMVPFATQLVVVEVAHIARLAPHHWHPQVVPEPHHLLNATPEEIAVMIGTGVALFALIHSAAVRSAALTVLRAIGWAVSGLLVRLPRWILSRPAVKRMLASTAAILFGRYVLRPAAFAAVAYVAFDRSVETLDRKLHPLVRTRPFAELDSFKLPIAAVVFVASTVLLNTRAGRRAVEATEDVVVRSLRRLERHLLPSVFQFIASIFRRLVDSLDRGLYAVDEWLRFHEGQSKAALAGKAVLGLVWFAFAYVLRIYVNLLLEPTFNPIKHIPTVTVAAKIMLPIDKDLAESLVAASTPVVGIGFARLIAGLTVVSLPGFFGFLVWELKENYKLYRATRAVAMKPLAIGHHGETMGAFLKLGFHSGTLPKLWNKLRRAARKKQPAVEKHREAMRELAESVEHFVDRELSAILATSDSFAGAIHVSRVALGSNRVRVDVQRVKQAHPHEHEHAEEAGKVAAIAFEEQSGHVLATVLEPGWIAELDGVEAILFENALAGLYHRAGVDFVREQLAAALPAGASYDVADEGLVVWPGGSDGGFKSEIVYGLVSQGPLDGKPRGEGLAMIPEIARDAIFFNTHEIAWSDWVEVWSGAPRRLVKGASLLPGRVDKGRGSL